MLNEANALLATADARWAAAAAAAEAAAAVDSAVEAGAAEEEAEASTEARGGSVGVGAVAVTSEGAAGDAMSLNLRRMKKWT